MLSIFECVGISLDSRLHYISSVLKLWIGR
jgi:hypothetical protein